MADEKMVEIKPIDLATVWGTAFGQIADLWISGLKALLEGARAEDDIAGESKDTVTVPATEGPRPDLHAEDMKGETFGGTLPSAAVKITPREPGDGTVVIFDCTVIEELAGPITGDIYCGRVVDQHGTLVGHIALDAGS